MSPTELTCRELVELITDHLEGALSAEDEQRFGAHLQECPGCRTYLAQIDETRQALGGISEERLDDQARELLLRTFRDWKRGADRG